jgi:putative ATP-dependent endonuclease of OLD family
MKIEMVKVNNYRNIQSIVVNFNPICNYIIGENNLGKSNFLMLLYTVCGGKCFAEEDFLDPTKSIEVELYIRLLQCEYGYFGDNFSPDDSSLVKIRYSQSITDAYPNIISIDSNEAISLKQIRKINFFRYETTAIPSKELRLDTQKGTGLLISTLINKYTESDETEFLNHIQIEGLLDFLNEYLYKIRGFKDYSIKATIAKDRTDVLTNLFYLSDGDRKIDSTGSGIQYMAMASITIMCKIMELYKSKSVNFSDLLYTNSENKKILPIVLSVDEPEVHLHPYLQRSLINYYIHVLNNEDDDFLDLIKKCFDIDGINGQLIVVTHSTDALVGDYRNLIRFYRNNEIISAISGYSLQPNITTLTEEQIDDSDEKHLIMRFPEIKEAFYSKCAILIEGATEYGCIQAFAKKMKISLDDNGICVINAEGEGSIKPIRKLLSLFSIPSIAMYDGDVKGKNAITDKDFYTTEQCFEIEIVKSLYSRNEQDKIRRIAIELNSTAYSAIMDEEFVKKHYKKMGIDLNGYIPKKLEDVDNNDKSDFCNRFSAWFMAEKGVILGRVVGENVSEDDIPLSYRNAIKKALEVATSE